MPAKNYRDFRKVHFQNQNLAETNAVELLDTFSLVSCVPLFAMYSTLPCVRGLLPISIANSLVKNESFDPYLGNDREGTFVIGKIVEKYCLTLITVNRVFISEIFVPLACNPMEWSISSFNHTFVCWIRPCLSVFEKHF